MKAPARPFRLLLCLLFFSLLSCLLPPQTAQALDRFVGDPPEVFFKDNQLMLHLRLSVDDEDGLRVLLRDGAVLELSLKIDVERKRSLWKNENIASLEFSSLLKFDPLTRQYQMLRPEKHEAAQSGNLRTLLNKTWKNLDLPLLDQTALLPEEEYQTVLSLSLQYTELPPWLDRSLVFWSRDAVQPETFKTEFNLDNAAFPR